MFIILSGAYVGPEIAAEFGRLPPSFLPLGAGRLYERQIALARGDERTRRCVLSLPEDFTIRASDARKLASLDVEVVRAPAGLSLRESALHVLETVDVSGPFELLYGDTLVSVDARTAPGRDVAAIKESRGHYDWAYVRRAHDAGMSDAPVFVAGYGDGLGDRDVMCGYFRFSDGAAVRAALAAAPDFIAALNQLGRERPWRLHPVSDWYDFGHLPLYFQSKQNYLVRRSFNDLRAGKDTIVKTSPQTGKMRAESAWYKSLPDSVKVYAPRFIRELAVDQQAAYELEYLYLPLLSELHVYGALPDREWLKILESCFTFVDVCRAVRPDPQAPEASAAFASRFYDDMFVTKTRTRLEAYLSGVGLRLDTAPRLNGTALPSFAEMVADLLAGVRRTSSADICFWHGDFFFGNVFYDFRAGRVVTVDPRGFAVGDLPCVYGDFRYDLAKLAHSVLGRYDAVIAGEFAVERAAGAGADAFTAPDDAIDALGAQLLAVAEARYGVPPKEMWALSALLFFAMLPLHGDDPRRQERLLANGLRLYRRFTQEADHVHLPHGGSQPQVL